MALPHLSADPGLPAVGGERPPHGGWYWNSNHLARAWLPLIGPEGLGLLDFYLAMADYRPTAPARGWAAVTLDELTRLTGWGRARLVRLNRLLAAAGLLQVCHQPVAGRGPAVQRALYRVERAAASPSADTLTRLAALAEHDPTLAARLRRYTTPPAGGPVGPANAQGSAASQAAPPATAPRPVPAARPVQEAPPGAALPTQEGSAPDGPTESLDGAVQPVPSAAHGPVPLDNRVPVPSRNRSEDGAETRATTTAHARADEAFKRWLAANGRPASCLERQRLAQLATQAEASAQATGTTGWAWVADAITEAVEAGSAYVAPRRVARILARWTAEGRSQTSAGDKAQHRALRRGRVGRSDQCRRPAQVEPTNTRHDPEPEQAAPAAGVSRPEPARPDDGIQSSGSADGTQLAATPNWQSPTSLPGLPAAPAAVIRAAQAAAGLTGEPYLRGAALAGWADDGRLIVVTSAPLPLAVTNRLSRHLARGLSSILGRPVVCLLTTARALSNPPRSGAPDAEAIQEWT